MVDFDTSTLSAENAIPARVLQLRAQIASGQVQRAILGIENEDDVPDFAAVKAFAQHTTGNSAAALRAVERLVQSASENATVQVLCATVLQAVGKNEDALALLSKHQGNLEAYGLHKDSGSDVSDCGYS